jgi:hypothetical protein
MPRDVIFSDPEEYWESQALMEQIRSCQSLEELQQFIDGGCWKGGREEIWGAIFDKMFELSVEGDIVRFGSDEFWADHEEEVDQLGGNINYGHFYSLEVVHKEYRRLYHTDRTSYKFLFRNLDQLAEDLDGAIPEIFQHALDTTLKNAQSIDKVGVKLDHPSLDNPICLPISRRDKITGEKLAREVEKV